MSDIVNEIADKVWDLLRPRIEIIDSKLSTMEGNVKALLTKEDERITVEKAAEMLGVSKNTIHTHLNSGELTRLKQGKRGTRIFKSEVIALRKKWNQDVES